MSTPFHTQVHTHGIKNEMFNRSMVFAIPNGLTKADVEGRAVTVDATRVAAVKLTGEGDPIVARIDIYEDRGLVTAQFRFSDLMPIKDGDAVAQGDTVVGAANGFVKKAPANDPLVNFVSEIVTRNGKKFASVVRL